VPAGSVLDITYRWMFDTDTHIREFELVQDRPDVIRARFVPGAGVSQAKVTASVTHLEQLLAVSLEQPMRAEVELVESCRRCRARNAGLSDAPGQATRTPGSWAPRPAGEDRHEPTPPANTRTAGIRTAGIGTAGSGPPASGWRRAERRSGADR